MSRNALKNIMVAQAYTATMLGGNTYSCFDDIKETQGSAVYTPKRHKYKAKNHKK